MLADGEFSLFPDGTEITEPDDDAVTFYFPTADDAIMFFEFWAAVARGEFQLFVVEKTDSQASG